MSRFKTIIVSIMLFIGLGVNAFASESNNFGECEKDMGPATPITSEDFYVSNYTPIGDLTEDELIALRESLSQGCNNCLGNRHFSLTPHIHEITEITSTYVGERNRGVVVESLARVPTTSQLIYECERSVSNSWSASISFEKGAVTAELGYNCEYSTSAIASYVLDVPPNKLGSITLHDMYDVTLFNCCTTWIYNNVYPISYSYEYGTGWSEQWTHFGYEGSIW